MMAASGGETEEQIIARLGKTPKEGERILAPTKRPDGTLRKPIRIRAGYVPQDEVAIYQSKGALLKKGMGGPEVPPGYDPVDAKPKTKSAKRNERKKEKKQQASLDKGKDLDLNAAVEPNMDNSQNMDNSHSPEHEVHRSEIVESVASHMNKLALSESSSVVVPDDSVESSNHGPDLDKRIRALRKKIRLTEAQQQKNESTNMKMEQVDKVAKLEGWRKELKLLEDKKAELSAS